MSLLLEISNYSFKTQISHRDASNKADSTPPSDDGGGLMNVAGSKLLPGVLTDSLSHHLQHTLSFFS